MPARRAMSSVEVPSKPRSANSTSAASSSVSLRSAAERRVVVGLMGGRIVMTHKLVKRLGDPVELRLAEPAVEGQGERPLEDRVGAGEGALPPEGAEPV